MTSVSAVRAISANSRAALASASRLRSSVLWRWVFIPKLFHAFKISLSRASGESSVFLAVLATLVLFLVFLVFLEGARRFLPRTRICLRPLAPPSSRTEIDDA
eukprot:TRINITY_DN20765_c0_g1::TRINITY_DN20765_c0_g1_i1::g.10737::m.10737 TRINITY_DN20765_c0_g1::TRINITY_DN20765_c0_g1_i1::g.10737  ORF type:complete len:103 (+),score=10.72,SecY/PF00344.15/0.062 TRINITY_DN20765_c0_g1_i1:121-429(+)